VQAPCPRLIRKRASASRPSGEWNDDDFDVLATGGVVGRIFKAAAAPRGRRGCEKLAAGIGTFSAGSVRSGRWTWTLAYGHHEDRTPTHGYAATRESAMRAFAFTGSTPAATANGVHGFHWFTVRAPAGWDPASDEWEVCPCGWRPELGKHYAKTDHVQWWREQIKERGKP
jgi:hypothetical protein